MADKDWIETEIKNLQERGKGLPALVIDILAAKFRGDIHVDLFTAAEQTRLASDLLLALRTEGVTNAD